MTELKIRLLKKRGWFWCDNTLIGKMGNYLEPSGIAIYIALCRRTNIHTQECYPSEETIGHDIGASDRTVRNYLPRLVAAKMIVIRRKKRIKGKWLNNTYILLDKSEWRIPREESSFGKKEVVCKPEEKKEKNQRKILPLKETYIKENKLPNRTNLFKMPWDKKT